MFFSDRTTRRFREWIRGYGCANGTPHSRLPLRNESTSPCASYRAPRCATPSLFAVIRFPRKQTCQYLHPNDILTLDGTIRGHLRHISTRSDSDSKVTGLPPSIGGHIRLPTASLRLSGSLDLRIFSKLGGVLAVLHASR